MPKPKRLPVYIRQPLDLQYENDTKLQDEMLWRGCEMGHLAH